MAPFLVGVIRRDGLAVPAGQLSLDQRVEICVWLDRGWSYGQSGAAVDRAPSTIISAGLIVSRVEFPRGEDEVDGSTPAA